MSVSGAELCRTCALQNPNLVALSTRAAKYANKSYFDVLRELTQFDPFIDHADEMPQTICSDCCQRLQSAYEFVVQAQQAQEQLLGKLRASSLEETPIDIPIQLHIKTEIDIDEERLLNGSSYLEGSETERTAADVAYGDVKPKGLRRSVRKVKRRDSNEDQQTDSEDDANLGLSLVKRRRGRPPCNESTNTMNQEGRYACDVCGKTFSWFRGMQRHARVHFEQASFMCEICGKGFLRKDKYLFHLRSHEKRDAKRLAVRLNGEWRFADRLYSSARLKRVECKLCDLKCQRIEELRLHLRIHANVETLAQLNSDNDVVKIHYAAKSQSLNEVRQLICADIAAQRLEKYYAVVNAHGYELSLSDSDVELSGVTNYDCLACNLTFTRKHRLIRHTLEEHTQPSTAPALRCERCQIGFICPKLSEQHRRTQCYNMLKTLCCLKCPGKFMWQQNLERHACSNLRQQQQGRIHCQCCLCDEKFARLSQLREHLRLHSDGRSGIDELHKAAFFQCYYPNGLACSVAELNARIAADFQAHDYGRYYNAYTSSGNELDLYDSDDDSDDESVGQRLELHTCALCGETTTRLSRLLQHQSSAHAEGVNLPHQCEDCQAQFICVALLLQHRRRFCAKKHAKYQCQRCKLRFVWQTNYELHLSQQHAGEASAGVNTIGLHRPKRKSKTALKLQCDECEKVFMWRKDLTRHMRMHQPNTAQYECAYCERKFHRKDGLKSHLRVHGEELSMTAGSTEAATLVKREAVERMPVVLTQLCHPNGCKQIQCMICFSRHTKIIDLSTHLYTHQYMVNFSGERSTPAAIAAISRALYPELELPLNKQQLSERIMSDVGQDLELERFYSITTEAGYELSLDSSETDTDAEAIESANSVQRLYNCELCRVALPRKHQIYAHQLEMHEWHEASNVCPHCNARFVDVQLLEHHFRTLCRNSQKRYLCKKCPLRFRWKENLKLHTDVAHQDVKANAGVAKQTEANDNTANTYNCVECKRSFRMQKDLTRHTLMHAKDSSIYRCRWCARRFYRLGNLLQHIERHGITADQLPYAEVLINANRHANGQKVIMCKVCELRFETIAALRQHLQTVSPAGTHHDYSSMLNYSITNQLGYELHIDDSETDEEAKAPGAPLHYTCGMCQLRVRRKHELYQHQQAMHRLERINDSCPHCIFKCVSPALIEHHLRTQCGNVEKQFKCSKCGYKFMWESNLSQHMQLQHDGDKELAIMEAQATTPSQHHSSDCQIFQCSICPRKYNRKDRLTAHIKKCHTPGAALAVSKQAQQSVSKQPLEKRFLCAFCGKAVSSSSNLIIHMRRHTGEKPFKCEFCDMAFPRSSDLQCHRRKHTGERPHVCTVCQKGFARSYKLQQHMRIHNGERPYKCTYCEKSFTQSNDLTLHIRRHTGERPYQCGTCGERFIQGTALKNHRVQHGHQEGSAETVTTATTTAPAQARRTVLEQFVVQ